MFNIRFLRIYGLTLLLLLTVSILVFQLMERSLNANLETDLKLESNILINLLRKQMNLAFIDIQSDLRFLTEQEGLHHLDRPLNRQHRIADLETLWTSFSRQRARYDQIRFIDKNGNEVVRVNYSGGKPTVVAQNKLQSKLHRYYFTKSVVLPPGKIYVSPLDLNVENHAVELPLKPMIRFASPVTNDDGEVIGVVVINYLAGKLLDDFRRTATGFSGQAMLVNSGGYPLSSPDSSQNWNFMFPDNPQTGIHTSFPAVWRQMKQGMRGQLITHQGIFTYDALHPGAQTLEPACSSCLYMLLHVPDKLIGNKLSRREQDALKPLILAVIVIALILGALIWHRDKRRIQAREISALNELIAFERNLFVSGPGIIAKLRNELGWPVEYISANIQELAGYEADDFQRHGLTYSSIIEPGFLPYFVSESEQASLENRVSFKRSPYRIIDRQGRAKWVQDISRTIRDSRGRVTHYFAHISDITALKDAEQQLTVSHDHIQKVVDTIPDPTLVIDVSNYQLQLANQSARNLYSGGQAFSNGMTCYRLSHKRDTPCTGMSDPCPIQEVLMTGKSVSVRHKHFDNRGRLLYVDVRATPLFDESGQTVVQIVESHRDVTETVEMEKQLQHMATTDRLTQIYNRLKFDDELKHQIEWAKKTENKLGLIMFDLDHFKQVNDNHGHDIGDEVLKNTVELVTRYIRKSDTLARWGGEEFMIIMPLTDALELKTITEMLRRHIEQLSHETAGMVTASFGGSVLRTEDTAATLVKRVDAALYQSKQSGRNRCTIIE